MPQFTYKARNHQGQLLTGQLEANDTAAVAEALREKQLFVVNVKQESSLFKGTSITFPGRRVKKSDLAVFCRQLATMVKAGIPLLTALDILSKQLENVRLKETVAKVKQTLEEGSTFAEALRTYEKVFPNLFISMVEAGETGGMLDSVLEQLAVHYEREHDINEKVKSAMTYPAVVLSVALLAVIFLLIFVLPTFTSMLSDLGAELPLPTRIVMGVSNLVSKLWFLIPFLIIGGFAGFRKMTEKGQGRYRWHQALLHIPIVKKVHLLALISRFGRTLGTLLQGGVPILHALEVVKKTAGNAVVEEGITEAQQYIREGQGMAKPLERCGVFPPMVIQMILVGEETGTLDDLLQRISEFYDEDLDNVVAKLSTIIEPVLIVVMGGIVGFIIISILMPMFNIYGAVGM